MAAHGENESDLKSHQGSYSAFTWMMKWGTISSFVAAAVVVLIIAS